MLKQQEIEAKQRERQRRREALEARILAMRKEFEAEDAEASLVVDQESARDKVLVTDRDAMARSRWANGVPAPEPGERKRIARRN